MISRYGISRVLCNGETESYMQETCDSVDVHQRLANVRPCRREIPVSFGEHARSVNGS